MYNIYIYISSCQHDSICICQVNFLFSQTQTALWRGTFNSFSRIISWDLGYPDSLIIIILWWHLTLWHDFSSSLCDMHCFFASISMVEAHPPPKQMTHWKLWINIHGKITGHRSIFLFPIGFSSAHWVSKQVHLPRIQVPLDFWRSIQPPKKSSSRPKQGSSIGSISSKHLFGNHQLLAGHREPQMLSCASNVGLYCLYSRVCFNNHLNLIGVYDFWKNKPGEITCCAQPKLVGTCGFVGLFKYAWRSQHPPRTTTVSRVVVQERDVETKHDLPRRCMPRLKRSHWRRWGFLDNHHENLCPVPIKWNNHHCGNDFSSGHFTKLENLENKIQLHIPRLFTVDEKQT